MSMTEARHHSQGQDNFPQRLTRAQGSIAEYKELKRKMQEIKLFPGNLVEFTQLNGGEYELIKLRGGKQFLEGGILLGEQVGHEGKSFFRVRDHLNPLNWRKIRRIDNEFMGYLSAVLLEAVGLGADALIYYSKTQGGFPQRSRETGVPIRRIDASSSQQNQ